MSDSQFKALEKKVDDLIKLCAELNRENVALKASAHAWQSERESLVARNESAQHKVESILDRLRAMEQPG